MATGQRYNVKKDSTAPGEDHSINVMLLSQPTQEPEGGTGAVIPNNLVLDLVGFTFPGVKRLQRLFAHYLNHRNLALRGLFRDLAINQGIVKPDFGGISIVIRKVNARQPGPVDCPQAHGAGLAGSIDFAAFKIEPAKVLASGADSEHFRMRGWIVCRCDLIRGLPDDDAVFHHDRAKRTAAPRLDVFDRELNGARHERIVHGLTLYLSIIKRWLASATREPQISRHGLFRSRSAEKRV